MDDLKRHANCYRSSGNTSFWQHLKSGQIFSLTESGDRYGLMTLDKRSGKWADRGLMTMAQVIESAAATSQPIRCLLLAATLAAVASPAIASPKPEELNLTINSVLTPLIWNYRRAEIEAQAIEWLRNGVETSYVRALIRSESAKSPTRTYKYSELDRLVDSIYLSAQIKAGMVARGLDE